MVRRSRLTEALKKAGKSQADLARYTGVSTAGVSLWFRSDGKDHLTMKHENLTKVAKCLGVSEKWLTGDSDSPAATSSNVRELPGNYSLPAARKIPVIDIVQAGSPEAYTDAFEPGDSDETVSTTTPVSEYTFALTVDGSSMTQYGERSYPDGAVIICDPALAGDVRTGDDVVARILETDARVFKSFDILDGKPVLVPLNKQYPVIHEPFEVLAVVVEMIVKRR